MKKLLLIFLTNCITLFLFPQQFEVPKNYHLENAGDYPAYEQTVIDCTNWLLNTPYDAENTRQREANIFLLKWLVGSPNVHIIIHQDIVNFMDKNPELLLMFMAGWAKYSLESGNFDNTISGNLAGIDAVIQFYTKNKNAFQKDKNVEKYIRMQKKGTLKKYIEDKMNDLNQPNQ